MMPVSRFLRFLPLIYSMIGTLWTCLLWLASNCSILLRRSSLAMLLLLLPLLIESTSLFLSCLLSPSLSPFGTGRFSRLLLKSFFALEPSSPCWLSLRLCYLVALRFWSLLGLLKDRSMSFFSGMFSFEDALFQEGRKKSRPRVVALLRPYRFGCGCLPCIENFKSNYN